MSSAVVHEGLRKIMPGGGLSGRRLGDGITMFIVTGLSLLLLLYVGFGQGKRTYQRFQIEKLTAQGRVLQNSIETYLRSGLPLKQYAGFTILADPIVALKEIDAIAVYDLAGRQLFIAVDKSNPALPAPSAAIHRVKQDVQFDQASNYYQVILPLRSRFETVGSLVVMSPTTFVADRVYAMVPPLLWLALGLTLVFSTAVWAAAPRLARSRIPWLPIGYAVTFLTMAGFVVASLIGLYSDGVQGKAQASAFTLAQRLKEVVDLNLDFLDLDGIDKGFAGFGRANPEIRRTALIIDGRIQVASNVKDLGSPWVADPRNFEYIVDLSKLERPNQFSLAVEVPKDFVYEQVRTSVRNFAALFIASGFLAGLFLQVASSMQRLRSPGKDTARAQVTFLASESSLVFVKPIFFLAVFLEHLTYSFLPKFMQEAATATGMSVGFASAPFVAYYLCFALSLIPAGHCSDRYGPKPLIWGGLVLSSASVLALAVPLDIFCLAILRAASGIGQGMLFIGIQTYILAVSSPEKKTQGASIIVFGYQGGMISGMAIGSLLVTYLGPQGVFMISAAIGFVTALYSMLLVAMKPASVRVERGFNVGIRRVASDLGKVISSGEFLKTMFCIGVPAKAILTGTITFALPLLLDQQGYGLEEIGQIIMLYGIGVVASSTYISRLVDRTGRTETILFAGAMLSGAGLVLIGLTEPNLVGPGPFGTVLVITGVMLVGVGHGFINAPVVTHVAHSELSAKIGVNPVTTAYRFLERLGHVAGPFVVAQLFMFWGERPQVIAGIGIMTAVFALFFIAWKVQPPMDALGREAVR